MKRMWKGFLILLIGGVLGGAAGFAVGIFVYPYIFLADVRAVEQVADRDSKIVVAKAQFRHADPDDPVHYGKGGATVFSDVVHLEEDFEVGPGPRFHVYLAPNAPINATADFDQEKSLDLGRLKAFKGSQNFPVPPGTQLSNYKSLVIYCKAFNVLVSPAELKFSVPDVPAN